MRNSRRNVASTQSRFPQEPVVVFSGGKPDSARNCRNPVSVQRVQSIGIRVNPVEEGRHHQEVPARLDHPKDIASRARRPEQMFENVLGDHQIELFRERVGANVELGETGLTVGLEPVVAPDAAGNFQCGQLLGFQRRDEQSDLFISNFSRPERLLESNCQTKAWGSSAACATRASSTALDPAIATSLIRLQGRGPRGPLSWP